MDSTTSTAPGHQPFAGFSELQSRHTQLLRDYHAGGGTEELNQQVADFIRRGCWTGELLDAEEERQAAQQILDHWATLLFRMVGEAPDATLAEFDPAQLPVLRDEDCPYLGLDAFGEDQHGSFFGRERLLDECANVLLRSRMLAVIGQSGSGKSSLVSGGLVAALKTGEFPQFTESTSWMYIGPVFPGADPVENFLSALLPNISDSASSEQAATDLRRDHLLLPTLLSRDRGMVLTVDQFEETFTLCENEETRTLFLKLLVEFTQSPDVFRRVIITMRSEFETWVARDPAFYPLFSAGQIRMAPMDRDELRRAIENPAAAVGLKFENGVVDALLHDTLGEPAALPMLQFALLKLWGTREHNRITLAAYEKLGGARLALANSANDFFLKLTSENQDTARRILLRMVRIGDGLEVHSQRVKLASLYETGEDPNRIDFVVGELARAHLVRISGRESPAAQIEVAHEALIRNWPTLLEWIQRKRTDLLTRRRLNEYAAEWIRRNRSDAGLLDAELLPEAERWIKSDAAREFGHHEALPALIEASRARQTEEAKRQSAELEARQKARLKVAFVLFLLSALTLAIAGYSYVRVSRLSHAVELSQVDLEKAQKKLQAKEKDLAEAEQDLAQRERAVRALTSSLPAEKPATEVVLEYSAPPSDQPKIDKAVKNSKFSVVRKPESPEDLPVNTLLYGLQVKLEDVKRLAGDLIAAGISLHAIDQITTSKASEALIQLVNSTVAAKGPALGINDVKNLTSRAGPDLAEPIPISSKGAPVVIFFAGENQREQANLAASALVEIGYSVSKPENIEARRFGLAPRDSEVRYFRVPADKVEADFISKLLGSFDPNLRSSYVFDPEASKRRSPSFEIWFSRKAFMVSSNPQPPPIARVFIRSGPKSRESAETLKQNLEERGFWTELSEQAEGDVTRAAVHYYESFPGDLKEASNLLAMLKEMGTAPIDEMPSAISAPPVARARHFEILIP